MLFSARDTLSYDISQFIILFLCLLVFLSLPLGFLRATVPLELGNAWYIVGTH